MKDGAAGDAISFRLEQVKVGTDEDSDEITSCVVVPSEDTPENVRPKLTPTEKLFEAALRNAIVDHGERRPGVATIPAVAGVLATVWKVASQRSGATIGATTTKSIDALFSKYRKSLLIKGVTGECDGFVWLTATVGNQGQP
jgi:hypothetical protein